MSEFPDTSAQMPAGEVPVGSSALFDELNSALEEGDVPEAFRLCEACLERSSDDTDAYRHLGLFHAASGARGPALKAAMRACELAPEDVRSWSDLGRVYAMLGDMEGAAHCFSEAVEIDARYADAWHNLGTACKQLGKCDAAFRAFKNALLIDPKRADTYLNLATLLVQAGQFEDAVVALERAAKHDETMPHARSRLAQRLSEKGRVKRAESLFRQSLAMDPDHVEGWVGLGSVLEDIGEREVARGAYLNVLRRRPDHAHALGKYVALLDESDMSDEEAAAWLARTEQAVRHKNAPDETKALIGYGLCMFHHRREDHAAAAEAGALANAARRNSAGPMDREKLVTRVDNIVSTYSGDFFRERMSYGVGNEQPVFIVGLPRSGTTLTEQILSSHPRFHGAGELSDLSRLAASILNDDDPVWRAAAMLDEATSRKLAGAYLRALRGGAPRTVLRICDKQPLNFFQLGFAALLFPNARVIHCRRDPRDTALSIWMQNFNPDQRWSTNFDDLAFYRAQYERLMAHWHEHLPLKVLDLQYEDVVVDLETQARRLVSFLGTEWDPACLNFHKSKRAVQTPSRWQVRQPIYTRAVARWKAYVKHLPDLQRAFAK